MQSIILSVEKKNPEGTIFKIHRLIYGGKISKKNNRRKTPVLLENNQTAHMSSQKKKKTSK